MTRDSEAVEKVLPFAVAIVEGWRKEAVLSSEDRNVGRKTFSSQVPFVIQFPTTTLSNALIGVLTWHSLY